MMGGQAGFVSGVYGRIDGLLYPIDDGSTGFVSGVYGRIDGCCIRLMMDQCWVTWSRVGTTCIVSAFVFAWNCNMLGCLPVLQFFG